jgi:hypothetical protein
MSQGFSAAEQTLYRNGPFHGKIDLWAENARYFRPIHASMMSAILNQIQVPLMEKGYVAGRETSLQIAEGREPDIYIHMRGDPTRQDSKWDYATAAEEVLAEPGVLVYVEGSLDALFIRDASSKLVTVLEIVSPGNKTRDHEILAYRERRSRLLLEQDVNVVEIDPTRSIKRLTLNEATQAAPYHFAIFLPGNAVRIVELQLNNALKRLALPLRADVVPVDLQSAYTNAYMETMTAWHIQNEERYALAELPFSSTLTDAQKEAALQAIEKWQAQLEKLREDKV